VLEFPTHVRARIAPACTTFYAAVMDGTLTHDGNRALARHVSNAVVKPSPQGDYITKPDPTSPAKIDLAVAAVVAFSASSAATKKRSPVGVF
jgi:phage terminase large subunit-like protein